MMRCTIACRQSSVLYAHAYNGTLYVAILRRTSITASSQLYLTTTSGMVARGPRELALHWRRGRMSFGRKASIFVQTIDVDDGLRTGGRTLPVFDQSW